MKRIALISFAAIAALVSCQKEEFINEPQTGNSPVFTASIASDGTKTTLSDDSPAKILWESSDKITIVDAVGDTAVYKLSAGAGTKSGTFVYDSGETLESSSTYTATYGAAPANYQVYSAAGSVPLYMTAPETSSSDGLVFTAQCGVLRVTLTDASHDIMRVEVSDANGSTYRVTSSSAVDVSSATKFYIALPAGTYTSLNIYDDNFQMVSKTGIELAVTAGHVKPAVSSSLTFTDCTTKGFKEINSVLRPIVQLWADGPFWSETNIGAETPEAYGKYFAWGYTDAYSWTGSAWSPSITFDYTGFPDLTTHAYSDMATAVWGTGWSVPTADQFKTLINASDADPKDKCSVTEVTEGVAGFRITGKTEGYTSNSIFLPAAGRGSDSELTYPGLGGYYWSSEQYNEGTGIYLCLSPEYNYIKVEYNNKAFGCSVRPVYSETPVYPEAPELACVKIGDVWWAPVNCGYDATHTYGLLYQWGRKYGQGYDEENPAVVKTSYTDAFTSHVDTDDTNKNKFYYNATLENWYGGSEPDKLWDTTGGSQESHTPAKSSYDPCPEGWRVPTEAEFTALISNYAWGNNTVGTVSQTGYWFNGSSSASEGTGVFLPAAGYHFYSSDNSDYRGNYGGYWSSSVDGNDARCLFFNNTFSDTGYTERASGLSVRCVQN